MHPSELTETHTPTKYVEIKDSEIEGNIEILQ